MATYARFLLGSRALASPSGLPRNPVIALVLLIGPILCLCVIENQFR